MLRYWLIGTIIFFLYLALYLYVSGFLILAIDYQSYAQQLEGDAPLQEPPAIYSLGLSILPQWRDLIFRQRSPFLFESIGILSLPPYITIFLSIPNLFLGLLLAFLVAANMTLSVYSFKSLGLKGGRGLLALAGTIPALLSGAACCVPILILLLGIQLSATLLTAFSLMVPLAIVLLSVSLWLAIRRIRSGKF